MERKLLKLDEVVDINRGAMLLQLRWRESGKPVMYHAEHLPFLIFQGIPDTRYELRSDQYGISWRCFDGLPMDAASIPWADGEGGWQVEEDAG